jgi:hypothetical protein
MADLLTDWFPADVKPTRPGWYECKNHFGLITGRRWWWDGEVWRFSEREPALCHQDRTWRGLTHPPN